MKRVMIFLLAVLGFPIPIEAQTIQPPEFAIWLDCIERGPYPGRAVADISYRYDGEAAITAEDSRLFGDTQLGRTEVFDFRIQPGEHLRDTRINVGADKVVTWKIILFGELHVVTAWDNPEILDCATFLPEPTPTPTEQADA